MRQIGFDRRRGRQGFTLMELMVVMVLLGVVAAIAIPRALKTSPRQQLSRAAKQMARDLELVRTQAVSSKRKVRVRFDVADGFYTAFLDTTDTRSGVIAEAANEVRASRLITRDRKAGIPGVSLPRKIKFGSGAAISGPLGGPASDPVPFVSDRVEFNSRGMVIPLGTMGAIFMTHEDDPSVVAAVTISGAGAFEVWHYREGNWER